MVVAKIVPADRDGDGVQMCRGTRVYVGDQELTGVTRIELIASVDDVWRARIECMVQPPADLMAESYTFYPTMWQRLVRWWRINFIGQPKR